MKADPVSIAGVKQATGLTQTEVRAVFRLIFRRSVPADAETVTTAECVLLLATNILKGYDFDSSAILTAMARMWAWLEDDDDRALVFNVIDRRYVGWNYRDQKVLVDMTTGDEVPPDQPLPRVGESSAYNPSVLFERQMAMVHVKRTSSQEGKDATSPTTRDQTPEGVGGLGEPSVLRDDPHSFVP